MQGNEEREWVIMKNGGQQIFGVLHRPLYVANPPVVVFLHGFASSKHGSNRCYVRVAESLIKVGIAALRFDFRGSGDSEGSLSDITFEDLLSDAVTVLEHLKVLQGVDNTRIALFGASLGGTIAILTALRVPYIKALALWAPVASGELWYQDFLVQHPEYIHIEPEKALNSYRGNELHPQFKAQFAQMFAYKTFPLLHPLPILHMHGEKDTIISTAHQEAFRHASLPTQFNLRFVKYPHGQHSLGFSPNLQEVIEESTRWFQTYL
jgi:alpha-beta hydrolase superfamily lysophospholipase